MSEPRWLGVAAPGLSSRLDGLNQVAAALGAKPTVATWYEMFWWKRPFPTAELEAIRGWGATPQLTWEPWNPDAGVSQPRYSLARIAAGDFDAYLTSWADGIKAWGQPLRIRFAHEANNRGYPWCIGTNGNTPDDFIRAWLHLRAVFAQAGAANVRFIWCPQNPYPGTVPLAALFPGDVAVDEVALDGYNWCLRPGDPWTHFVGVFRRGITELAELSARPVSIGETGCPELGDGKAAWIRAMWSALADWPQVRGLTWFNFAKEADWRVDSSPAALAAFRDGLPGFLAG